MSNKGHEVPREGTSSGPGAKCVVCLCLIEFCLPSYHLIQEPQDVVCHICIVFWMICDSRQLLFSVSLEAFQNYCLCLVQMASVVQRVDEASLFYLWSLNFKWPYTVCLKIDTHTHFDGQIRTLLLLSRWGGHLGCWIKMFFNVHCFLDAKYCWWTDAWFSGSYLGYLR